MWRLVTNAPPVLGYLSGIAAVLTAAWTSLMLGLAAFAAQMLAALVLTRGLAFADRVHLGLAQQNGITAVSLALAFERDFPGFVAIVAPAIVTVNLVHVAANRLSDAWQLRRSGYGY
ncbi:hypothetical protein [Nonomuraea ceibae]|uniref:hypothetical protein n=1 Tax=Nonomuraea ceibae TaxID=1935170 RepID=UPI001C5E3D40|nr:hypothetical protein [Nonomuraea ceibae]